MSEEQGRRSKRKPYGRIVSFNEFCELSKGDRNHSPQGSQGGESEGFSSIGSGLRRFSARCVPGDQKLGSCGSDSIKIRSFGRLSIWSLIARLRSCKFHCFAGASLMGSRVRKSQSQTAHFLVFTIRRTSV